MIVSFLPFSNCRELHEFLAFLFSGVDQICKLGLVSFHRK